jgi:DegV family protein with EDD domain
MPAQTPIGLVTDSPCDLPLDLVEKYQIQVVPAILVLDGQSYRDGETISREEFYRRLPDLRTAPSTAAPSPLIFAGRYEKLLSAGCEHVICVSTAASLTSLHGVAEIAAAEFSGRVTVLDSGQLTLGIGFQVLAAAEAIAAGAGLTEVLAVIESTRQRVRLMGVLDTLEYVRRSGRVPGLVASLGGLLSLKPVVTLSEGVVRPLGAVRTTRQANQRALSLLLEQGSIERLAVLHTNAEARAREFIESLSGKVEVPSGLLTVNLTSVLGTHLGPNGLGFAAVINRVK